MPNSYVPHPAFLLHQEDQSSPNNASNLRSDPRQNSNLGPKPNKRIREREISTYIVKSLINPRIKLAPDLLSQPVNAGHNTLDPTSSLVSCTCTRLFHNQHFYKDHITSYLSRPPKTFLRHVRPTCNPNPHKAGKVGAMRRNGSERGGRETYRCPSASISKSIMCTSLPRMNIMRPYRTSRSRMGLLSCSIIRASTDRLIHTPRTRQGLPFNDWVSLCHFENLFSGYR